MLSRLPFNMLSEFKGKCSKKKLEAEEELNSFFDLDSEVMQHHVCHTILAEAVTVVRSGSRRGNVDPVSPWKNFNIT